MTLGDALRKHRRECTSDPNCAADHACPVYVDLARAAVAKRQIWEGPRHAHSRLSIIEATLP